MATATTTRPVDLTQLAAETGWPLSMHDTGTTRTITCHSPGVTNAALETAINTHEPAPPPPTEEEVRAAMQTQIDELADLVLIQGLML